MHRKPRPQPDPWNPKPRLISIGVFLLSLCIISGCAAMRKNNKQIALLAVENGTTQTYVLKHCGKPTFAARVIVGQHIYSLWRYDMDGRTYRVFYFKDGIVNNIQES